jgi:hypothetical protein
MSRRGSQASATLRFPREVPPECSVLYIVLIATARYHHDALA